MMFKKPQIVFWGIGVVVFATSQLIRGLLEDVVYNQQLAFGLSWPSALIIPTIVVFLGIVIWWFYSRQVLSPTLAAFFGLVLGGGMSNLFERIIANGLVADYWDMAGLFTFNLADVSILAGIVGLMFFSFYVKT